MAQPSVNDTIANIAAQLVEQLAAKDVQLDAKQTKIDILQNELRIAENALAAEKGEIPLDHE